MPNQNGFSDKINYLISDSHIMIMNLIPLEMFFVRIFVISISLIVVNYNEQKNISTINLNNSQHRIILTKISLLKENEPGTTFII